MGFLICGEGKRSDTGGSVSYELDGNHLTVWPQMEGAEPCYAGKNRDCPFDIITD